MSLTVRTPEQIAADASAALRARIQQRRDAAIAVGITVNGAAVQTDDLAQQRFAAAALSAVLDPDAVVRWRLADGTFTELNSTQIIALAQAVRAHVQACFDHEADLLTALEAGEPVNIDAGWPGA